jgi:heme exporter protein C
MAIVLHKLASPKHFYHLAGRLIPWFGGGCLLLMVAGLYGGLVQAPADYQQGDSYRIIFVHVPAAWMSLFIYLIMAIAGAIGLIWHIKLADVVLASSAPLGASFTFLALVTGSLWGKPMWGAWWVWDARLTSELILLFLYLGVIGLQSAFEDRRTAARASAVLTLVGVVNIPIIHYSVEWWNTLHQGPTVTRLGAPAIHYTMLIPLLIMALAFMLYYLTTLSLRARCEVLDRERHSSWVQELIREQGDNVPQRRMGEKRRFPTAS